MSRSIFEVGRLITSGLGRAAGAIGHRRPSPPLGATALRLACAAALDLPVEDLRPGSVRIQPIQGSYAPFGSPCPLAIVQTIEGAAVKIFAPLLRDLGPLLAEPPAGGAILSPANQARIIEALEGRFPLREVWHQALYYTDRAHFLPDVRHRVVPLPPGQRPEGQRAGPHEASAAQGALGIAVRGEVVAYADYAPRSEYCASVAVYTDERFRGQGLGRSVVSAATKAVLAAGKITIYSADIENIASQAVCTSLGYAKFGEDLHCFV